MKTNKSFTKRLKVTKNGKVLARRPGKNHFRAKKSRVEQIGKNGLQEFRIDNKKASRLMPGKNVGVGTDSNPATNVPINEKK